VHFSKIRIAHGERLDGHVEEGCRTTPFSTLRVRQASTEHFEQCAEFPALRNRGLGLVRKAKKVAQKVSVPAVCSYKGEEQPENICLAGTAMKLDLRFANGFWRGSIKVKCR